MHTWAKHQSSCFKCQERRQWKKGGMRNTSGLIRTGIRRRQISPIINKWLTFPVCVVISPRAPARTQQGLDPIPAVYQCEWKRPLVKPPWHKHLGDKPRTANRANSLLPLWFTAAAITWYTAGMEMTILLPHHDSLRRCHFISLSPFSSDWHVRALWSQGCGQLVQGAWQCCTARVHSVLMLGGIHSTMRDTRNPHPLSLLTNDWVLV